MVTMIADRTGRFPERPYYLPGELDQECERIITRFLSDLYGEVKFPVTTDDLTKLIERDADDLDLYADLSEFGPDVEGVTEVEPRGRTTGRVSAALSADACRENRLRTTLTHEYGHVRFHAYLWAMQSSGAATRRNLVRPEPAYCKRDNMLDASRTDWMEWQAGYACGALLMPKSRVEGVIARCRGQYGSRSLVGRGGEHVCRLVAAVVDGFQVSRDAARVRLAKLGYLDR